MASSSNSTDLGKLLLRLGVAGIIIFHGIYKAQHGVEWIKGPLTDMHLPGFLAYGTYIAEIVAPILIIAGFATRIAALAITLDMLMTFVLVFKGTALARNDMGGGLTHEVEAMLLICSLALVFIGGGKFGITGGKSKWD